MSQVKPYQAYETAIDRVAQTILRDDAEMFHLRAGPRCGLEDFSAVRGTFSRTGGAKA